MTVPYRIKEMVHTIQGEGSNAGRVVVLCRFEGCNLSCDFCDTDHEGIDGPGGGEFGTGVEVAERAVSLWRGGPGMKAVLCTGGEPLLQLDAPLVEEFHRRGFSVLVETNGTLPLPTGVDFVCVSPKAPVLPVIRSGDELKLPFPLPGCDPGIFLGLDFRHFFIQPVWGRNYASSMRKAVEYCMEHPEWRISMQMHRYLGIP